MKPNECFFYRWTLFLLVQWWVRRRLYSGAWKNCRTPPETMMFRNHGDGFHCHFWLPEGNTLQWHVIQPYIYSYLYYITLIHIIYIYIYAHMYTHTRNPNDAYFGCSNPSRWAKTFGFNAVGQRWAFLQDCLVPSIWVTDPSFNTT